MGESKRQSDDSAKKDPTAGDASAPPVKKVDSSLKVVLNRSDYEPTYKFEMGDIPMWKHGVFADLFFHYYLRGDSPGFIRHSRNLRGAFSSAFELLSIVVPAVCEDKEMVGGWTEDERNKLRNLNQMLGEGLMFTTSLPAHTHDDRQLHEFLMELTIKAKSLRIGDFLMIPGGFSPANKVGEPMLFVLHRRSKDYSFCVCNTGDGVQYHPFKPGKPPEILYKFGLVFDSIPVARVTDSSFWFMLLRIVVCPSFFSVFFLFSCLPTLSYNMPPPDSPTLSLLLTPFSPPPPLSLSLTHTLPSYV